MLLRPLELALLLNTRASVVLTQGLDLGPLLDELLRETTLRRNVCLGSCQPRDATMENI